MNRTTIGHFLEDGGPNTSTFWNRTHRKQFRIYNMCSFMESRAVINRWGLVISPCSYYMNVALAYFHKKMEEKIEPKRIP